MDVWKEFEANELTHSMAHYLTAIRELISELGYARATDIAKKLAISRSSVSIGLRTLLDKQLVREDNNKFVRLTNTGEQIAAQIVSKQIILRRFLEEILHVKPHQAEIDTCKIEHLISSETGARLLDFLRFMTSDNAQPRATLQAFWANRSECEGLGRCPICTDQCLRESLPR